MKPETSDERRKKELVAVHGVPRSGTTWVGEILNSSERTVYKYQPLFSYAFKGRLTDTSSQEDIDLFFSTIAAANDDFLDQVDARSKGSLPNFRKMRPTHIVYKEVRYHNILRNMLEVHGTVKLIAVVRNPIEVINSWLKAPKEFRPDRGWIAAEEWRHAPKKNQGRPEEFYGFEKWKQATLLYHELRSLYPDRVSLLEYARLRSDPYVETESLFAFCGLKVGHQTSAFVKDSTSAQSEDAYSVYRSAALAAGNDSGLDTEIRDAILEDINGTELARYAAPLSPQSRERP